MNFVSYLWKIWGESLQIVKKQGALKTVSKLIKMGFPSMMIGIVVFSMLMSGSQNSGAAKKQLQKNKAKEGRGN